MRGGKKKAGSFAEAVNACPPLRYRDGLGAIKTSEGKGQIRAEDPRKILGSVDIEGDCRSKAPRENCWDYVVGYERSGEAFAHYIEVHSAETSEVSVVEDKLAWLEGFLRGEGREALAALPREIHWVASGRINIPQHTPQYKKLQTTLQRRGLRGPVKALVLT